MYDREIGAIAEDGCLPVVAGLAEIGAVAFHAPENGVSVRS